MSVGPPGAELRHRLGTLIGRPRRRDLLERLVPNGVGAELGVFRGEFSRELLEVARPRRLYLVDGWWELHGESFPREWGEYSGWGSASTRDAYMAARRVVAEYAPASNACEIHVGDDLAFLAGSRTPTSTGPTSTARTSTSTPSPSSSCSTPRSPPTAGSSATTGSRTPRAPTTGRTWRSASSARVAAGGSPRATTSLSGSSSGSAERTPAPQRKTRVTKPSRTAVTLRDVD